MATVTQEKTPPEECSCLYWAPFTYSCLLVKDTLFMPSKGHVLLYCHSCRFSLCPHYQQLVDAEEPTKIKQAEPLDHRRSIRFPGYHNFRFSKVTNKHFSKAKENNTWTFDMSEHGVRFASEQVLTRDTAIRFFVEDDEITTRAEGVGRVVWCAPLANTSLFQVGVSFDLLVS